MRSLEMGVKPCGASVLMVSVPLGFVMRMVLASGWVVASVELEITGRMKWSGG